VWDESANTPSAKLTDDHFCSLRSTPRAHRATPPITMGDDIATLVKLVKEMRVEQTAMAQQIAVLTAERASRSKTPSKKATSSYVPPSWASTQGIYLAPAMKDGKLLVRHIVPTANDEFNEVFAVWNGSVFTADYDDGSSVVYETLRDFAVDHKERPSTRFQGTKVNIKNTDGWEEVKYEWAPNKWRAVSNLRPASALPDSKPRSVSRAKTPAKSPAAATGSAPVNAPKPTPPPAPKTEKAWLSETCDGDLVDLGDGEGYAYDINLKTSEVKNVSLKKIVGTLNQGRFTNYKLVEEDNEFLVKNLVADDYAPVGSPDDE
jgi:hypothetical protein